MAPSPVDDSGPAQEAQLNIADGSSAIDVPVFSCIVYLRVAEDNQVRARVANLSGIECTASSERAALGTIVPAFKQRIIQLRQDGESIPWIDPPVAADPDEQQRFIPVHL